MKIGTPDLRRWEMGDPAIAYERMESATCKGCQHISSIEILGERRPICAKGKPYGRKCRLYVER